MSISAKERQDIPRSEFGVPGKRKYPLDSPEHIESAARLINHGDITSSEKKTLANKILRRANEEGVDTSGMDAVKKIAEQVPPMSDGTSRGNVAPHLMAPYLEGKDELFARLHGMKEVEALTIDRARTIVNQIKTKVEADSKPPTGNQNCQLCVWCAEAQCRGMHVLPRPIYSPRDPALEIIGETIVKNPVRQKFTSQRNLIDTVRGAVDSRWYVHVNWKDSEGGHEFLVVNIQDYAYLMDPQAGIFQELGTLDSSHSYFRDANMMNSYMVRLDNRTFNSTLLADVNDMSKVLPWDPKLDIPYMKEHGLLSDEDYQLAMNMGDLPVQEAACTASLLNVKNQLMNLLGNDFEFIGGSLIPKFTMKSRMKPDVAIEVNIVGPNVEVTPVYKGIPDILHKRKGIALMQASHVVADFANELVDKYNPTAVKEWCESYIDYGQALSSMLVFEAEVIQRKSLIARIIEWCRGAVRWLIDKIKAFFGWDSPAKTKTDVDGLNNIAGRVIDQINSDDADEINVRELQYELDEIRSNNEQIIENPKQVLNDIKTKTNEINSILGRENLPEKTVTALKNLLTEYMSLMKDIEDSQNGDKNIIHALKNALTADNQSGSNTIQVYPYFYGRTFYNDFHSKGALIPTAIINSEMAYKTLIGKNIRCFDKYYDREMHVNVTYANGFYTALLYIFLKDLANKVGYQPEIYDPDGRHPNAKQYMEDKVGRPLYVYIGYIIPEDEIKANGIPAISYQMLWDMYIETMERIFYEKDFSKTYLKSDMVTINANPMPKVVKESFMDEYAPYQEGTGIIEKARNMTFTPVRDFKYDKVFYGDPTNGGSVRVLNGKPLFVTPYPGLASIFLGRRHIFRQLSQMGYHEVNLGYDEWGELERCDQPLTDVHVYVKNQPDLKPFTAEYDGYLHTIDCSQLKENIFRYPWMSDPDHEVLIAKVPEVKIETVQRLHIKYHVRGIRGKVPEVPYQESATAGSEPKITNSVDEQLLANSKGIFKKYLVSPRIWKYYSEMKSQYPLPDNVRDALFSLVHVIMNSDDFQTYDKYRKFLCEILGLPNNEVIKGDNLNNIYRGELGVMTIQPETKVFQNAENTKLYHTSTKNDLNELRPTFMSAKTRKTRMGTLKRVVEALYPSLRVYFGYDAPCSRLFGTAVDHVDDDTFVYLANHDDIVGKTIKGDTELRGGNACFVETTTPIRVSNVTDNFRKDSQNKGNLTISVDPNGKVHSTVTQEGAFQDIKNGVNPYSSKLVFHVTDKSHFDGQIFEPRVPEYLDPYDPNDKYFEDNTTPRVCFSTSIEGALNGIMCNMERDTPERFNKMYVYIPEKPFKEYKHKTTKDIVSDKTVWDANVTREVWITEPVRMKLYGVIQVDQVSDMKRKKAVPNAKNEKHTRPYFTFKWHWVVPPKVLEKSTKFDYSIDKVAMWLSNDLKKFKYGLIKNGRLQIGNVSESDYQKYWVYHSGEEVDQAGGGNCWDYVEYEAGFLEAYGVPYKKYFMNFTKTDGKTSVNTHTICVVPYEGKFIYIEGAFKRITSEWGHEWRRTFDSLEEIFKYVAEVSAEYENQDLNYGVWDYTDAKIDYGTPADDFCNWIMSKCKMVYDGEAKKTMLTKEGYRMDQTEDLMITESKKAENLSETEDMEDITIGDLNLDDEENGDETEESISVEETPLDDVEWDGESEDNEPKDDDDVGDDEDDETPSTSMPSRWDTEKTPPELEEIPGYLKDRMSAADKAAVKQPDEKLDADNVDLGQFGKDTSDMQNDYDQKEVTILMKLMASEADAMNEYMDGAKETNVDVLRRLYADIANEERFHMEQLLYAKCELTGEKYEPKDPDVKSEYQELLEMGMDEETAMQTAIDKCHIRGSISISDDGEEIASLKEDVQTLESALMMFDAMYQSTEIILESGNSSPEDVDKAVDVFVESCLMQEAVYDSTAAKSEKHPLSRANRRGPIQLLRSAIGFVIKTLMTLIRKFVEFCNRIRNHSRSIKRFIQQYGMQGIFEQKYFFYFINLNFPESSYVDEHLDTLLALAYDTVEACAQYLHIKLNNDNIPADVTSLPRDPKLDIRGNMERGAELLAGAHLVKSAFVVPQDSDTEQRVSQALFGYSDTTNQAGKSNNTLNEIRIRCDRWSRFMQYVNSVLIGMDAMTQQSDSIYYTDQKRYDKGVKILTTVVKTCKAWISAMQYDINQIMGMNQELLKKTEESDTARIENDQTAKTKNETYNKFYSTPESTPQQRPSRFSV